LIGGGVVAVMKLENIGIPLRLDDVMTRLTRLEVRSLEGWEVR
jgi:hypothetical protein